MKSTRLAVDRNKPLNQESETWNESVLVKYKNSNLEFETSSSEVHGHVGIVLWIRAFQPLDRILHYYTLSQLLLCKKCDINVKEYRNAGLLQNKSTRVAKYLIPVIIVSVLLNIPKFLETSVAYDEETGEVIISLFLKLLNIYLLGTVYGVMV